MDRNGSQEQQPYYLEIVLTARTFITGLRNLPNMADSPPPPHTYYTLSISDPHSPYILLPFCLGSYTEAL